VNHTHTETKEKTKPEVAPCPPQAPEPVDTCCELVCFERPRYFCGHLLTDADLTKEQKYVIEKHKLYNRSLHGHGVVCGLRLTCNHHCPGEIIIGDGYAIDNCGNDLVLCEAKPFDVIRFLRRKGYLVEEPRPDPCKPGEEPRECKIKECFYIVACYAEEESDFTTPLVKGCRPTVSECEPTRVREMVSFDVLDKLPTAVDPFEDLKARIEKCWKLFTDSRFSDALLKHREFINKLFSAKDDGQIEGDCFTVICELKRLLLLHLQKYPDHYNCTTEEEIRKIRETPDSGHYIQECRDAICRLLELAYQYVISCVWGELVVPCSEPTKASCVVLGTVEVESGRLMRVCNCPRSYIWSFANFSQVLMEAVLGSSACNGHREEKADHHICCNECKLDCEHFFRLFGTNRAALPELSTYLLQNIPDFGQWFKETFDLCRQDVFPAGYFRGSDVEEAQKRAQEANVRIAGTIDLDRDRARRLIINERLSELALVERGSAEQTGSSVNLVVKGGKVVDVRPAAPPVDAALSPEEKRQLDETISGMKGVVSDVAKLKEEIIRGAEETQRKFGDELNGLKAYFDNRLAELTNRPPPGEGGGQVRRRRPRGSGGGENP
jgi:hypothetical protein